MVGIIDVGIPVSYHMVDGMQVFYRCSLLYARELRVRDFLLVHWGIASLPTSLRGTRQQAIEHLHLVSPFFWKNDNQRCL
jgi:hypothetical protein